MPELLASIVTVTWNDLGGLEATGASLTARDRHPVEWIVIDGNSTDGTVKALKSGRIAPDIWISEPDGGIYEAMNKGIGLCKGRYIVFLNAGDDFVPHGLSGLCKRIEDIDDATPPLIFFGTQQMTSGGKTVRYRSPKDISSTWHSIPTIHQSIAFPSTFAKMNMYRTDLKVCGDYDLVARAWRAGIPALVVDEPLAQFELGGISSQRPLSLIREAAIVQREVLGFPRPLILVSAVRRAIAITATKALASLATIRRARNERGL